MQWDCTANWEGNSQGWRFDAWEMIVWWREEGLRCLFMFDVAQSNLFGMSTSWPLQVGSLIDRSKPQSSWVQLLSSKSKSLRFQSRLIQAASRGLSLVDTKLLKDYWLQGSQSLWMKSLRIDMSLNE
jgi:hypothetical protein